MFRFDSMFRSMLTVANRFDSMFRFDSMPIERRKQVMWHVKQKALSSCRHSRSRSSCNRAIGRLSWVHVQPLSKLNSSHGSRDLELESSHATACSSMPSVASKEFASYTSPSAKIGLRSLAWDGSLFEKSVRSQLRANQQLGVREELDYSALSSGWTSMGTACHTL